VEQGLIYGAYAVAGVLALAVYLALPKEGRATRRGAAIVVGAVALGSLLIFLARLLGESRGEQAYFYVLSGLAIIGGIRVITHSRPVYSALYFVLVVLSTAALVVMVGAQFLAAALVIVYAGAILVTYVFVIMMAQQSRGGQSPPYGGRKETDDYDRSAREPAAAVLAGFVLVAVLTGIIAARAGGPAVRMVAQPQVRTTAVVQPESGGGAAPGEGNTMQVARALLQEDGFPVRLQVAGVLLLVAMVGALVIAQRRLPRAEEPGEALPLGEIGKRVKPF
jgi:NADH-quinone oxidoreductase subunit J